MTVACQILRYSMQQLCFGLTIAWEDAVIVVGAAALILDVADKTDIGVPAEDPDAEESVEDFGDALEEIELPKVDVDIWLAACPVVVDIVVVAAVNVRDDNEAAIEVA